jgi:catechol 2,3-dioxygenase-like lactoylglutathione lyase family enzyme
VREVLGRSVTICPVVASAPARVLRVYETVLYAADLPAAAAFYSDVLGLRLFENVSEFGAVFQLDDGGMFLIFEPSRSSAPGRDLPSHGAAVSGHVAFTVEPGSLDAFEAHLRRRGVEIECDSPKDWGGRSLYVRDPAGNVVELVDGGAWQPRDDAPT